MAKINLNFLEDIDRLFKERTIDEIVEIEKLLDAEIENKRIDLRSMVGDRYKDVLTASDAIKSMKSLSETIVENIQKINDRCEHLIDGASIETYKLAPDIDQDMQEELVFAIQIRLTININEQIWVAIDEENNSKAAQLYLLGQHIHTGLRLQKSDVLERLPILKRIKATIEGLRSRILEKINEKLKTIEISAQETSSNLTALMLLENETSLELVRFFVEIRKAALNSVIESNHPSVRAKIAAMVRCLITTVHLLHDCFLAHGDSNRGLIWQELEAIVNENAPKTLSKVNLPLTPLTNYISEIIKQFRPKCTNVSSLLSNDDIQNVIQDWLKTTSDIVNSGLKKSLELVTNIKGLHIIREEALKSDIPEDWDKMCIKANLPVSFDIWCNFFQTLVSNRARFLISKKGKLIVQELQKEIADSIATYIKINNLNSNINNNINALDNNLQLYTWTEDSNDVSRTENKHLGLAMKTKGFSPMIVKLCEKLDAKYLEFLQDLSFYLYGKEFDSKNLDLLILNMKNVKKFVDKDKLEQHLIQECKKNAEDFVRFLHQFLDDEKQANLHVSKSLICARFLQGLTTLSPHYHKCCSLNNSSEEWDKICNLYNQCSLRFWQNWVEDSVRKTDDNCKILDEVDSIELLTILPKWDAIEIQEQAEEKVFNSQIKVPSQCSLSLRKILTHLNNNVNTILPHTMPKQIHLQFIEKNVERIFSHYNLVLSTSNINQIQALQFLFDVKFLTSLAIPRENIQLIQKSQEICDKLRSKVDPFDLDVFYSYLQHNVKQNVLQSQVILGCLLPNSSQLANLGVIEKNKEQEKDPSALALSVPSNVSWFPLLPVTAPMQKTVTTVVPVLVNNTKDTTNKVTSSSNPSKTSSAKKSARSGAASLFGAMATDWFS